LPNFGEGLLGLEGANFRDVRMELVLEGETVVFQVDLQLALQRHAAATAVHWHDVFGHDGNFFCFSFFCSLLLSYFFQSTCSLVVSLQDNTFYSTVPVRYFCWWGAAEPPNFDATPEVGDSGNKYR
jgi:hypothetical protein